MRVTTHRRARPDGRTGGWAPGRLWHRANNGGSKAGATVLNVGMPNGPQTENHNPFLGSSSGASLGYRWMILSRWS